MTQSKANQKTELQQAIEQSNPTKLADNLKDTLVEEHPQSLNKKEATPFIDDTLRTDK